MKRNIWLNSIACCGVFLIVAGLAKNAYSATYYISPSGNDSSGVGTNGAPWKTLSKAMSVGAGGDTFIFRNGTYDYSGCEIDSKVKSGTAGAYTVIRAESDGGAVMTLSGSMNLPHVASYIRIEGFKFIFSDQKAFTGNHLKIFRCSFSGGPSTGNTVNTVIGTNDYNDTAYILFEDCWWYGPGGRYKVLIYNSDRIVIRRGVIRDDGGWTSSTGDPEAGIVIYQSSNVSLQNVLVVDSDLDTYDNNNIGGFYLTGHAGNRASSNASYLGCMAIKNKKWGWSVDTDDGGVGLTFRDIVIYGQEAGGIATSNTSMDMTIQRATIGNIAGPGIGNWGTKTITVTDSVFWNLSGYSAGGNTTLTYSNTYNPSDLSGTGVTHLNPLSNGLTFLPRIETGSTLKTSGQSGGQKGAQISKKIGILGTLHGETGWNTETSESLWPWPYESRIKNDMAVVSTRGFCASNMTLTKYIWEYLGSPMPSNEWKFPVSPQNLLIQ